MKRFMDASGCLFRVLDRDLNMHSPSYHYIFSPEEGPCILHVNGFETYAISNNMILMIRADGGIITSPHSLILVSSERT